MRRSRRTAATRWAVKGAALALGAALAASGAAAGQETDEAEPPAMAEAPEPFRVGPSLDRLSWEEAEGRPALEDVTLWGLGVERVVASFVAFRLDGGYGSASVTAPDGGRTVDANTYLAELALAIRAPVLPLQRVSVVPYAVGGIGTVVHDPTPDDLSTATQNALSYGLGVDVRPLRRFGARLEWRRYSVQVENLFAPADLTGSDRGADRLTLSLYWAF